MPNKNQLINSPGDLKKKLAANYQKQIKNYFGDEKRAMKFLSSVVSSVQRNPKLLDCDSASLLNSFVRMAELELMPSDVSGEAYVVPYKGEAQFQLGYKGIVTLLYRAGIKEIKAEIVHEKDDFSYENGDIYHSPDVFGSDRGDAIGAYVIITLDTGGKVNKVMTKEEILEIAKEFSKSYGSKYSAWSNDPQKWMWKKTVLKQAAKLVPKSDKVVEAISDDNEEKDVNKKPEVNIGKFKTKIKECESLQQLKGVWSAMPIEAKDELKELKDDKKEELTQDNKDQDEN